MVHLPHPPPRAARTAAWTGWRPPHHRTARAVRRDQPGQLGPDPPRPRRARRGARARCAALPARRRSIEMSARAADAFLHAHAAARSTPAHAVARRLRRASSRPPPGCRTCWCAATCSKIAGVIASVDERPRRPHARPRPRASSTAGFGEVDGRARELLPARRLRSASCCRATRRACTRCGRPRSRSRRRSSSSRAAPSRGRPTAWPRRSSRPAARPRRSATTRPTTRAPARSCARCGRGMVFGDVGLHAQWAGGSARRAPRPRLQQGRASARDAGRPTGSATST